jgi:hypothetical protein
MNHVLGSDRVLIGASDVNAGVMEVNAGVMRLLTLCHAPRSIHAHAAHVAGATGTSIGQAEVVLEALRQEGLLRPISIGGGTRRGEPRPARITACGIPTADRPDVLRRALRDASSHVAATDGRVRCFVFDGSRNPVNGAASRRVVQEGAGDPHAAPVGVTYIGRDETVAIARVLAKEVGGAPVLRPAFASGSAGSQRNLLLSLTAGQAALMVDDDIRWTTWQSEHHQTGVVVAGHTDLRDHRFFASRAEALGAITEQQTNLFGIHEAFLGAGLGDMVGADTDVSQACGHVLALLDTAPDAAVRVTMTGLVGDSGFYCPFLQLFAEGSAKHAMWGSREVFVHALSSREVYRIANQVVVTHDTACMAGCLAVSNNELVPPFMWIGRNEDGVFGAALGAADPHALFAHLPWGVVHDSGREPAWPDGPPRSATQTRISEVLLGVISGLAGVRVLSGTGGMKRLVATLRDLGSASIGDFRTCLRELILHSRGRDLAKLQTVLATDPGAPEHWRVAAELYVATSIASLATPEFCCPHEFRRAGRSIEDDFRECQQYVAELGDLFEVWPHVWKCCQRLGTDEILGRARSL